MTWPNGLWLPQDPRTKIRPVQMYTPRSLLRFHQARTAQCYQFCLESNSHVLYLFRALWERNRGRNGGKWQTPESMRRRIHAWKTVLDGVSRTSYAKGARRNNKGRWRSEGRRGGEIEGRNTSFWKLYDATESSFLNYVVIEHRIIWLRISL